MMSNHIAVRREARRQRKARWMIGRCYTQPVQITDIIIESMPSDMEPIVIDEAMVIEVEPIVMQEKTIISSTHVDEASQVLRTSNVSLETEELRKLLILHQTIKKFSSKKSNLTLCI